MSIIKWRNLFISSTSMMILEGIVNSLLVVEVSRGGIGSVTELMGHYQWLRVVGYSKLKPLLTDLLSVLRLSIITQVAIGLVWWWAYQNKHIGLFWPHFFSPLHIFWVVIWDLNAVFKPSFVEQCFRHYLDNCTEANMIKWEIEAKNYN